MARSASDGVERATKAYPTGREVRGLVGMVVDSLRSVLERTRCGQTGQLTPGSP